MGFFANILGWLRNRTLVKYSAPDAEAENPETSEPSLEKSSSEVMLVAFYDKHLFERARTQWQFGDWESLAQIERESLYHHPQRASLALLAAAGHQQSGNMDTTREFTRLAKEWGASKKMISQVLIAGVYNTLGKASALCGQQQRAIGHFQESLRTARDGGDVRLLTQARAGREMQNFNDMGTSLSNNIYFPSQQITDRADSAKTHKKIIYEGFRNFKNDFQYSIDIQYNVKKPTLLAELCDLYGSDKGTADLDAKNRPYGWPPHSYVDLYSMIFDHCRFKIEKVFECGIGTNNPEMPSNMTEKGKPGASLRVWRDYFPNAQVVGVDIDKDILFTEERIETYFIDQTNKEIIKDFWGKLGKDAFELILDDGLHEFQAGICLFENSINYLSDNGVYIIEDITTTDLKKYLDYFSNKNYNVNFITMFRPYAELNDNNIVLIKKA